MNNSDPMQIRNLMWIDILSSDLNMKKLGVSNYAEKLESYYYIVDAITQNFNVTMIDTLGDGISINSVDNSTDSLINAFFAIQKEVSASTGLDVKAGIHTGEVYAKDITLSTGMKIPLVAGAINEVFRLETFCKVNKTSLLLSPEAYSKVDSDDLRESFILSKGAYKRKTTFFSEVYKYAKFL